MNKKGKKIIILLLVLIAILIAGFQLYNKPHIDVESSKVDLLITAEELVKDFEDDESTANEKYLDQILEVKGTVKSITYERGNPVITLTAEGNMSNVMCYLQPQENLESFVASEKPIQIKGICTGYLLDVVIVKCVITNQ